MCDCIKIIEENLTEEMKKKTFKKPFEKIRLETVLFLSQNTMKSRTHTRALITLTGQKKALDVSVFHSFCPFCGEKQD